MGLGGLTPRRAMAPLIVGLGSSVRLVPTEEDLGLAELGHLSSWIPRALRRTEDVACTSARDSDIIVAIGSKAKLGLNAEQPRFQTISLDFPSAMKCFFF